MNIWGKKPLCALLLISLMLVSGCQSGPRSFALKEGDVLLAEIRLASEPERRLVWKELSGASLEVSARGKVVFVSHSAQGSFALDDYPDQRIEVRLISLKEQTLRPAVDYLFLGMAPVAVTVTKPVEFERTAP